MSQLPFDTEKIFDMLLGALNFFSTYRKDSTPSLISTKYLTTYQFTNRFSNYIHHNCSKIEQQALLALSFFKVFEATQNPTFKLIAERITQALADYFYIDNIPSVNNTLWYHHALNVAYGSVKTEGSESESNPFNYGNFETVINFTSGLGTISSVSNLSRVFKVYPIDSFQLFKNVYADLNDAKEFYEIEYYVVTLNGSRFRVDSTEGLTVTTEVEGTIKLSTTFTGQAKAVWCQNIGTVSKATTPLSGQGLIENYPIFYEVNKGSNQFYLKSSFQGLTQCYDLFNKAYEILDDEKWLRAKEATKYTFLQSYIVDNPSYFYIKEDNINPFSYPGTYIRVDDSRTFTGVTTSRETYSTLLNYLKVSANSIIGRKIEIINDVNQSYITTNTKITLEVTSTITQILEISLNTSKFFDDVTQQFKAKRLISSTIDTLELSINDFIRWTAYTIWQPENNVIVDVTNDGSLDVVYIQDTYNNSNQIVKQLSFDTGLTGTAIATLDLIDSLETLPKIIYKLSGDSDVNLNITDSANNTFTTLLPTTDNWLTLNLDWSMFDDVGLNVVKISFEAVQGESILHLFYVGADPFYMNPGIIYKASIIDKDPSEHTLWIGNFKTNSNSLETLNYIGVVPSYVQVFRNGSSIINKNYQTGLLNVGSQSPYHLDLFNSNHTSNVINFLYDALIDYRNRTSVEGVLTPVFVPAIWKSLSFTTYGNKQINQQSNVSKIAGSAITSLNQKSLSVSNTAATYNYNEFGFKDFKPDSTNFYNVCKAVESVAKYLQTNKEDLKASTIVNSFVNYINNLYIQRASVQPPTDVKDTGIEINYHNPAIAAVIGRIALYANLAGVDATVTTKLIKDSYDYIVLNYVESGLMFGSWSKNQSNISIDSTVYKEYSSLYHSECLITLSEFYLNRNLLKYGYVETVSTFPLVIPDYIDNFKLPEYRNSTLKFTDNEQTLILLNDAINTEISLRYNLIDAEKMQILLDFWKDQGKASSFKLPDEIWKHPDLVTSSINFEDSRWMFNDNLAFNIRVANKDRGLWNLEIKLKQVLLKTVNKKLNSPVITPEIVPIVTDEYGTIITCPLGTIAQRSFEEFGVYMCNSGTYTIPDSYTGLFRGSYEVYAKFAYNNIGSGNLCSVPDAYLGTGVLLNNVCLPYDYVYMGSDLRNLDVTLFGYGSCTTFSIKLEGYKCL